MRNRKIALIILTVFALFFINNKTFKKSYIDVIIKNDESQQIKYLSLDLNKNAKEIEKFKSDDFIKYTAAHNSFTLYIYQNKVLNKLNKVSLKNNKDVIQNDQIITEIFQLVEKLEHELWMLDIYKICNKYFVSVQLNVNWISPNNFYEYDQSNQKLKLLYTFNDEEIVGMSLLRK